MAKSIKIPAWMRGTILGAIISIIILLLVIMVIASFFKGCEPKKPERDFWTIEIGSFTRENNDLRIDATIREVGPNERNSFTYPKQTKVYADLFYGYDGKMEKEPFLRDCEFPKLEEGREIRYLRFFSEYSATKDGKPINFRIDIKINGKTVKTGEIQEILQ